MLSPMSFSKFPTVGWSWGSWPIDLFYGFGLRRWELISMCHGAIPRNQLRGVYAWTGNDITFRSSWVLAGLLTIDQCLKTIIRLA